MSRTIPVVDWSPEVLPCAPRPINGELLSSWARRLAAANGLSLPEICACIGDQLGGKDQAAVFNYGAPKLWRFAMAKIARVPERWVWVLDLQQHFPAVGREWFLHDPAGPEQIVSGFCPECFREQIAGGRLLHLKAEWSSVLVTRCFEHQLPLYYFCPWCGQNDPVHFLENRAVECLYCEHDLCIRRWTRTPPCCEPLIVSFERAVIQAWSGTRPDPRWGGEYGARDFRTLLNDLVWILTTMDLVDPRYGAALVDYVACGRFVLRYRYGEDFELPFYARSRPQREAVVCALIQVLCGSDTDGALGVCRSRHNPAAFRPFVEILRYVRRNPDRLWSRIRRWPGCIQDRAGEALRFLESRTQRRRQ